MLPKSYSKINKDGVSLMLMATQGLIRNLFNERVPLPDGHRDSFITYGIGGHQSSILGKQRGERDAGKGNIKGI